MAYKTINVHVDSNAITDERMDALEDALNIIFNDAWIGFGTNHKIYDKD